MIPRWAWLLLPLLPLAVAGLGIALPFALFWFAILGIFGGIKATGADLVSVFRGR